MDSVPKFRWTTKAKVDFLSMVNAALKIGENWSHIATKFKQSYPHYKGKPDSLRIQYERFNSNTALNDYGLLSLTKASSTENLCDEIKPKNENITTSKESDTKNCTAAKFFWDNKALKELFRIVDAADKTSKNWPNILLQFKQVYSNYMGKHDALKKQYERIKAKNIINPRVLDTFEEKFVWTEKANEDLISIVNATDESQIRDWSNIAVKFQQIYPKYEGSNKALGMQYLRTKASSSIDQAFNWSKRERLDLLRLANSIRVLDYPNWTKIWYTFKRYHQNYLGSKEDLRSEYEKINNDGHTNSESVAEPDKLYDWNENMDDLLAKAVGHAQNIIRAQIRDGRRKNTDNLSKMAVKVFKEFYKTNTGVDYIGAEPIIFQKYHEYKENMIPSSYACEEVNDSVSNVENKTLQAYASKNHTLAFAKVFGECCHNCGVMFARSKTSTNRKMLLNAINGLAEVTQMVRNVPYMYYIDEKFITCVECFRKPTWTNDYSLAINSSKRYQIPQELCNLNVYEQNQIALCGGFYTLYRKQNPQCKIFEHRQGESNIGRKRDSDYHNMFTTYYNVDRPQKTDSSNRKIKTALLWLKRNNRLYNEFLSNYETIYGYLISTSNVRPEERIIQISKGNLADLVGKDKMGLLIPADNVKIESNINAESHKFGVQHPYQENLKSLRDIIFVNYNDPDLEAKRWPHLFPEGNGSWKKRTSLKQQTYVKHRLLGIDPRFRKNNEFMFFWYDRLLKERLLYYNNRQRTVNVTNLMASIQVKDVREHENKYGSVVPSSITGSKTYWNARKLDLLALVRDLGKPALFVTLTQNDNWLELQQACGEISVEELEILDQPIMQPAIGGKSVVNFPVETVVAFFKRLDMFMKSCIHNKNGPFGEVMDFWYRIEYQNRGALHCHMLLWICEETIPENIVMAEMPRYSGSNTLKKSQTFQAREYVKTFQMHTCNLKGCRKDINSRCKYGFPYDIQLSDEINESKMGFKYMRRCDEDKNVVPYNIYALMCWNGHINVQKVTSNGIEAYLCKYVSKPERSIDIKDVTSDADKFLKARVVGILECCAHLLQFKQVQSTRKTLFLPCDFQPAHRMLKRKSHLPEDLDSEDIYYQTLLYKYLIRPKELFNFTYIDMFRFYDVVYEKARVVHTQTVEPEFSQDESESEIQHKCDETQHDFSCRVRKIKSQRKTYVWRGYKYVERGKAAVPRWRFLVPFGNESEKYYEQRLLINVPISEEDLNADGYPFSEENESKTFVEECCLRGLVDSEETAKSALLGAVQRGFSVDRVIELATLFVDQSFVTREYVDSIIVPWVETMPDTNELQQQMDIEYGEELSKMIESRVKFEPFQTFVESMTDSQLNVMQWVDKKIKKDDQILAILSGGAGVGKSFITRALYSYFVERKMVCILLATTGSAAHLISGTTVHYYLKADIHGNNYLQAGTISAKVIEDTDVIIVDEFSMLSSDLLSQLNDSTKEFGKSKLAPFGGKHLFLIGDPCQLPAINTSVFLNPLLDMFSILILKETVRQKDEGFAALLNRIRVNMMSEDDKALLRTRYTHVSNIVCDDETLIVTATRQKMHTYNNQFISRMHGQEVVIQAQDFESDTNKQVSSPVKEKIRRYVKNLWDEKLIIKEGCIVRLLRNLDVSSGWVNSKRAKVFRVANDGSYIVLQDINDASKQLPLTKIRQPFKLGAHLYYRLQYPLILGYATTVHAVQGTTVTGKYYVDLDRSFWESGQAFVALSRPKELSQLFLLNTHFEKVYLKPYYKTLLNWMAEVDEIAIMRKPRCNGDFPLIPNEDAKIANMQVFPSEAIFEKKDAPNTNAPFKAPRTKGQESKDKQVSAEDLHKLLPLPTVQNPIGHIIGEKTSRIEPRVYKLAEAFTVACRTSSPNMTKIRFGIKFMNFTLEVLNETLDIDNVIDPVMYADVGRIVSDKALRKWDEQKRTTLDLFGTYATQFRTEFEAFANLISTLDICIYAGQQLASNVSPFFRDNRKFQPVSTAGDGRCFYHSISMNLLGNDGLSNSLKMLLSFAIWNEFDIYDAICSNLASSANNVLLKTISHDFWADMEVITAMAYALQHPILVLNGLDGYRQVQEVRYNPEAESNPILIAHVKISKDSIAPNHFVALLRDESYVQSPYSGVNLSQPEVNLTISLPDNDFETLDSYESDESL